MSMAARNWFYLLESCFSWFFQQTSVGKERVPKPRTLTIIAGQRCRRTLQHLLCLPLQEILISMIFTMHLCFFSRNSGRRVLSVLDSIHGCSHLECFFQEFSNSCCSSRNIYTCLQQLCHESNPLRLFKSRVSFTL